MLWVPRPQAPALLRDSAVGQGHPAVARGQEPGLNLLGMPGLRPNLKLKSGQCPAPAEAPVLDPRCGQLRRDGAPEPGQSGDCAGPGCRSLNVWNRRVSQAKTAPRAPRPRQQSLGEAVSAGRGFIS